MTLEIYHQLGNNYKWNLQSLRTDNAGDGVIFSPKFIGPDDYKDFNTYEVWHGIFDPQFFLPNTAKSKLSEYQFFPDFVAEGFQTSEYGEDSAYESARRCVKFQFEKSFRYITIPTRYLTGMPSNFIKDQQELFVTPFMDAIAKHNKEHKVILQLVLNSNMIKNEEYSADILNWITGLKGIDGVYLICDTYPRLSKQISDADFLFSLLTFIDALIENQLVVVLGYLNCESILLSIASPTIVAIGTYENTRMFNIRDFQILPKSSQKGPSARLYMSKLLQWVNNQYLGAIKRALPNDDLIDHNQYEAEMFIPTYKWHFSKPELYKHALLVLHRQLKEISQYKEKERFLFVKSMLASAADNFSKIELGGVVLDRDSNGEYLSAWLTAVNQFGMRKGWS